VFRTKNLRLLKGHGQFDIKVDAANRPYTRRTSNVQGSDDQSPRANLPRGAKERAHRPGGKAFILRIPLAESPRAIWE
jgi:hypothetical protein